MSNPVPDSPKWQPGTPEAKANPLEYYRPNKVEPSPPDDRDYTAEEHSPFLTMAAPRAARPRVYQMPDPWGLIDQKTRGSCSAFQACGMARTSYARVGVNFDPSEEAQYALVRQMEGQLGRDDGAYPRDNMKAMADVGIADEADAEYMSQSLTWTPDGPLRAKMANRKISKYFLAPDDETIKQAVWGTGADDGFDVAACFILFKNFWPDPNTNIPMPAGGQWGGHAMRIRGWDDDRWMPGAANPGAWYVKNQWNGWGDAQGCAWISYDMCHLDMNSGGMWYGDTWVAVVDGTVNPPTPPDPQPDTAFHDGWVAAQNSASSSVDSLAQTFSKRSSTRKVLLGAAQGIRDMNAPGGGA